jgi:hypothetical protein
MQNISKDFDLSGYIRDDGTLRSYTLIGCYPIFYLDSDNNCLCPKCASENDDFTEPLVAADCNWEDPDLYCDHCSERIESAYAEPE